MAANSAMYEIASAAELARQPAKPKTKQAIRDIPWMVYQNHLNARLTMLQAWRYSWSYHWSLLETYILPRRGIFINPTSPTPNQMVRGSPVNTAILDPTGTQAMRLCAASMMGGLMSAERPWFKLKPAMAERGMLGDEVEGWCEEVGERM